MLPNGGKVRKTREQLYFSTQNPNIRMSKEENVFQLQLLPEKMYASIKSRKHIPTNYKVNAFSSANTD